MTFKGVPPDLFADGKGAVVEGRLGSDGVFHATTIMAKLRLIPGLVDLDTTYRGGKPEVAIGIDRDRAADLGVPVSSIASTVRAIMGGDPVSQLKDGVDLYDITLRLPRAERCPAGGFPSAFHPTANRTDRAADR